MENTSTITQESRHALFFELKDKQRVIAQQTGINVRGILDELSTDAVTEDVVAMVESYLERVKAVIN